MARDRSNSLVEFVESGQPITSTEGIELVCNTGIRGVRLALKNKKVRAALTAARECVTHSGFNKTLTIAWTPPDE